MRRREGTPKGTEKRTRGRREGKGSVKETRERCVREGWSCLMGWENNEGEGEGEETERTNSARKENENKRKEEENRDTSRRDLTYLRLPLHLSSRCVGTETVHVEPMGGEIGVDVPEAACLGRTPGYIHVIWPISFTNIYGLREQGRERVKDVRVSAFGTKNITNPFSSVKDFTSTSSSFSFLSTSDGRVSPTAIGESLAVGGSASVPGATVSVMERDSGSVFVVRVVLGDVFAYGITPKLEGTGCPHLCTHLLSLLRLLTHVPGPLLRLS
jgi:hypothetical protein